MADYGNLSTQRTADTRAAPKQSLPPGLVANAMDHEQVRAGSNAAPRGYTKKIFCRYQLQGVCAYTSSQCGFAHSIAEQRAAKARGRRAAKGNAETSRVAHMAQKQTRSSQSDCDAQLEGKAVSFSCASNMPSAPIMGSARDVPDDLYGTGNKMTRHGAQEQPNNHATTNRPDPLSSSPFWPPPGLEDQVRMNTATQTYAVRDPSNDDTQRCAAACVNNCSSISSMLRSVADYAYNSSSAAHYGYTSASAPGKRDELAKWRFSSQHRVQSTPRVELLKTLRDELVAVRAFCMEHDL